MLALCAALAACAPWQTRAPVTPVSYETSREQLPRTVGKLRRLAAVQVNVVPPGCAGSTDGRGRLTELDATAREWLVQRKGYELLEPDAAHPLAGLSDPQGADGVALASELLAVDSTSGAPGPVLAAWLGRLRASDRVDGVVVVKLQVLCPKAMPLTRAMALLLSFGVSEVVGIDFGEPVGYELDAKVIEAASSALVWRHVYGQMEQRLLKPPQRQPGPAGLDAVREWSIRHLLEPIEPAVPRLLTR